MLLFDMPVRGGPSDSSAQVLQLTVWGACYALPEWCQNRRWTHPVEAADDGHAKVSNLEGARAVAEYVVRLDVHDNDTMAVQELQPLHACSLLHTQSRHSVIVFCMPCTECFQRRSGHEGMAHLSHFPQHLPHKSIGKHQALFLHLHAARRSHALQSSGTMLASCWSVSRVFSATWQSC